MNKKYVAIAIAIFAICVAGVLVLTLTNNNKKPIAASSSQTPKTSTTEAVAKPGTSASASVSAATGAGANTAIIHKDLKLKRPLVVFTFDDGYESDYVFAYSILKKYGIRGTSYINPDSPDRYIKLKLSWDEITKMYKDGWDFGCHTYAHSNVTKITAEELKKSMLQVNEAFEKHGMKAPEVHAYPYGKYNQAAIDVISKYRKQARLAFYKDDFVELKNLDPYQIPSISADMQKEPRLLSREKVVDKAVKENAVIVFRTHCMFREKKDDMGKWSVQTSSALFAKLVDYCVKKGCEFTTMDGLLKMYSK